MFEWWLNESDKHEESGDIETALECLERAQYELKQQQVIND